MSDKSLNILALDMASKTGWAYFEKGEYVTSGRQDFTKKRGEDNGILFLRFRKWLLEMLHDYNIDIIGYERAHFRGGDATEIGVGLQGHCMACAREMACNLYPAHTATIKKWATGNGKASKEAMIEKAAELSGKELTEKDDDEADAIILAALVDYELNPDL